MNGPVDEIRRLRDQLAAKDRELAELRGLVNKHLEATKDDEQRCLDRERAAHERGLREGRETGWRQGVEHALIKVEDAHLNGTAHDYEGQMKLLGLHDGPVPKPATPEQRVAAAEKYTRLRAAETERQYDERHPKAKDYDLELGA